MSELGLLFSGSFFRFLRIGVFISDLRLCFQAFKIVFGLSLRCILMQFILLNPLSLAHDFGKTKTVGISLVDTVNPFGHGSLKDVTHC